MAAAPTYPSLRSDPRRFRRDRNTLPPDRPDPPPRFPHRSSPTNPPHHPEQWLPNPPLAWSHSNPPVTARNSSNHSSWRSHKQAVEPCYDGYDPSINTTPGQYSHHLNQVHRQDRYSIPAHANDYGGRLKPAVQSTWRSPKPERIWNSSRIQKSGYFPSAANSGYGNASPATYVKGNANSCMGIREAPCIVSQEMTGETASRRFPASSRGERTYHPVKAGESTASISRARPTMDRDSELLCSLRNSSNNGERNDEYPKSMSSRRTDVQTVGKYHERTNGLVESPHSPPKSQLDKCKDEVNSNSPIEGLTNESRMKPLIIAKESGKSEQGNPSTFIQELSRGNDNVPHPVRSHASTRNISQGISITSGKSMSQSKNKYKHKSDTLKEATGNKQWHDFSTHKGSTKFLKSDRQSQQSNKKIEEVQTHDSYRDREQSLQTQNISLKSNADVEGAEDGMVPSIAGTCEDMCPIREREQRERLRDLAVFERVNGDPSKTSQELAVKKFCRTFSGMNLESSDIRTLQTLKRTLLYLLNILDCSEFSFDVIHAFLFDRTRAIRQELGMQRIANSQAINMYERIVRFHILSEHELRQRGSRGTASGSHLNLQQLSKSLLALFDLYRTNLHEKLKNEGEFHAYYVLLNLGNKSHNQSESLSLWFRDCPSAILNSGELKFARKVLRCYQLGNYKKFFQLVQDATFFQYCLMELHFNEVRIQSLAAMNHGGYKLHPIALADICNQLLMMEGDLEELCNLCGLSTGLDANRVRCLFVKQSQFSVPSEIPSYRCPFIFNKRPKSYFAAVTA